MVVKKISYTNPMDRYYFQSFYDNVLVKMFDSDVVQDFFEMFSVVANPSKVCDWYCQVLVENGVVVAGISYEYLPKSQCGMFEYCGADENHMEKLGGLVDCVVDDLRGQHPDIKYIFAESLRDVGPEYSSLTGRLQMLDFDYKAPALDGSGVSDKYKLALVWRGDGVPGDVLTLALEEYFTQCYGTDLDITGLIPDGLKGKVVFVEDN